MSLGLVSNALLVFLHVGIGLETFPIRALCKHHSSREQASQQIEPSTCRQSEFGFSKVESGKAALLVTSSLANTPHRVKPTLTVRHSTTNSPTLTWLYLLCWADSQRLTIHTFARDIEKSLNLCISSHDVSQQFLPTVSSLLGERWLAAGLFLSRCPR